MTSNTLTYPHLNKGIQILGILLGLALIAVVLSYTPVSENAWSTFSNVFLGIFIEAVPFLLFGTLASAVVEVFVDRDIIRKITPQNPFLSALSGTFLGLLFPVCECGVIPLVRRLIRKGMPIPAGISFLLAAPVINPIVIFSTATAFGFGEMLFLRIGSTLVIALITGLIFSAANTPWEILQPTLWITPEVADVTCECVPDHADAKERRGIEKIVTVLQITLDEFFEIGRFLILGAAISSAIQTFIPQSLLYNVGKGPILSIFVMIGLAILLSICSTVDSFVALGFVGTFNLGAVLAFLVYGPMMDIKSFLMILRILRPRPVVYFIVIPFLLVVLVCVSLNYFLPV